MFSIDFQSKNIETLCANIKDVAQDPDLKPYAEEVVMKFTRVLNLFSKCHNGYNSSNYKNTEDIKQLGIHITLCYKASVKTILSLASLFYRNSYCQLHGQLQSFVSKCHSAT